MHLSRIIFSCFLVCLVDNFGPGYYSILTLNPGTGQFQGLLASGVLGLQPTISIGADGDAWNTALGNVYHYSALQGDWEELSNTNNYVWALAANEYGSG
jgi:hypothetical protein